MMGNLLVNVLAFVKSLFIAAYYGTSANLDVYFLSLAPFNLISGVLLSSIQAAFIPRYLELTQKKGKNYAFAVFVTFLFCVLLFVGIVSIIFLVGSSMIASYLGTGFTAVQVNFTASLLRVSTLLLVFTVLSETGRYLFNAHRQFTFSAFIPLLSCVCSFVYLIYFHAYGVSTLMYGLVLGMFIQSCVIIYSVRRFFPYQIFILHPLHAEIQKTLKVMFPLLLGASFGHVNIVIDQMMASTLPGGSIAALNYAIKLHSIFTQMFIMVVSRAVLPFFAQQVAENNMEELKETFSLAIKRMLYMLLPISFVIIGFGEPIVRLLFQRGEFSVHSTSATAGAWIAYTLGLPVQAIGILTARMYNALQNNKTLMYVSGGSIGLNILFNWIFMKIWGHIGIALSTSGVYVVTTIVLVYFLNKKLKCYDSTSEKEKNA